MFGLGLRNKKFDLDQFWAASVSKKARFAGYMSHTYVLQELGSRPVNADEGEITDWRIGQRGRRISQRGKEKAKKKCCRRHHSTHLHESFHGVRRGRE